MGRVVKYTPEEDATIREFVCIKTAEEIGLMLGRPTAGISWRIKRLGLVGTKCGVYHWNCKYPELAKLAITIMADGGLTTNEIHSLLTKPSEISLQTVCDIAAARTRRNEK